ncbi:MAG: zinc ribbon domain-containing protein [Nitrospirota bacterium]
MPGISEQLAIRTESLTKEEVRKFFVKEHGEFIAHLLNGEQYLVEGSRGVGKTMLMRYAEIEADRRFHSERILASYISFEDSLKIERLKITNAAEYNPFLQWTMAKILKALLDKVSLLKIDREEKERVSLISNLGNVFGTKYEISKYRDLLEEYINVIERAGYKTSDDIRKVALGKLNVNTEDMFKALNNPIVFKKFLEKFCEENNLHRLIFLFDEAAHTLSEQQQEEFFSFMKGLRSPKIACKAAVYPGISSYGKEFDYGHDARVLRIDRKPEDIKPYINFFKEILEKRISEDKIWRELNKDHEILEVVIIACFGNPRHLFLLVDEIGQIAPKKKDLPKIIKGYVEQNLWKYYLGLEKRLERFKIPVDTGYNFITSLVISDLRTQNNKWRKKEKPELSIYFAIENEIFDDLKDMIGVLIYSGILSERGQQSIGQNKYGKVYAVNTAICMSENVLKEDKLTGGNLRGEIEKLNRQRVKIYYKGTPKMTEIVSNLAKGVILTCPNCGKERKKEWKICPYCAQSYPEEESLYEKLRKHPVDYLPISERLKNRVKEKFETIGQILDASEDEVDEIYYVGTVRVKIIKTAAIEYMAG